MGDGIAVQADRISWKSLTHGAILSRQCGVWYTWASNRMATDVSYFSMLNIASVEPAGKLNATWGKISGGCFSDD